MWLSLTERQVVGMQQNLSNLWFLKPQGFPTMSIEVSSLSVWHKRPHTEQLNQVRTQSYKAGFTQLHLMEEATLCSFSALKPVLENAHSLLEFETVSIYLMHINNYAMCSYLTVEHRTITMIVLITMSTWTIYKHAATMIIIGSK